MGRASVAVRDLDPGYFALVMATGIISEGLFQWGPAWLSRTLLVLACAGGVVLVVALAWRAAAHRRALAADLRSPERAFGFFSVVAALGVLGSRLDLAGHPAVAAGLSAVAAALWLVLTYAVPASVLLPERRSTVLSGVNGTWLVWVVATQSLAVVAGSLAASWPSHAASLAPVALALWGVGVFLYLLLASLVWLRWLTMPMSPDAVGPPYWILMGATAISVLAGARIVGVIAHLADYARLSGFVEGLSFMLWAFGTWYVPLLVVLGVWRHVARRVPLAYEPSLWSLVFPLGMYSVATASLGRAMSLGFMAPVSHVAVWVALAAWALVAAGFLAHLRRGRPAAA